MIEPEKITWRKAIWAAIMRYTERHETPCFESSALFREEGAQV
jgi:hypothetical protein